MIWVTLYLAAGMCWCALTYAMNLEFTSLMLERDGVWPFVRGVALNLVGWPACIVFNLWLMTDSANGFKDKLVNNARRRYIDGEKWDRVLADPPQRIVEIPHLISFSCGSAEPGETCGNPQWEALAEAIEQPGDTIDYSKLPKCGKPATVSVTQFYDRDVATDSTGARVNEIEISYCAECCPPNYQDDELTPTEDVPRETRS